MKVNWIIIAIVVLIGFVIVVYTIVKNRKDEKELTKFLNEEQNKPQETEVNDGE